MDDNRRIYRSSTSSQHAVKDVLASFFLKELLAPSKNLFLMEPWISNVVLLDNRVGRFDAINPDWGRREIPLVDILTTLALSGTELKVITRPDDHCKKFLDRLKNSLEERGLQGKCFVREVHTLHTKGILSDNALIMGSMNLTEGGIRLNDEQITIEYGLRQLGEARVNFEAYLE
jgi:hypothetical protein